MKVSRRNILKSGIAATAAASGAVYGLKDEVRREMQDRTKFLSPPDGGPVYLSHRSPMATPFADKLYIPPVAKPLFEIPAMPSESDESWWNEFVRLFEEAGSLLLDQKRIDLGGLPDPDAHQRFWEFRPRKFYVMRELEFAWGYHSDYCLSGACMNVIEKGERAYKYPGDDSETDDISRSGDSWTWGYQTISIIDGEIHTSTGSPGPTYHAKYGEPIIVRRINALPEAGDQEGNSKLKFALPSTTSHLHNAHTASESDGFPNDWINPGEFWDHHYANFAQGFDEHEKLTTLWYHDHRMDFTASNVYAGLDGFYFLFDEEDTGSEKTGWHLPSSESRDEQLGDEHRGFDIPLLLHDLAFSPDATSEDHNASLSETPQLAFDRFNTDGILGDRFTVNRSVQPNLQVQRRKYRFRLLNGGPSRFWELFLHLGDGSSASVKTSTEYDEIQEAFVVIAGDGNFQHYPLLAKSIYLGVAQRVDVIVDFSSFGAGDKVYMVNRLAQVNGRGPTGKYVESIEPGLTKQQVLDKYSVLRFDVEGGRVNDDSVIKLTTRELPKVDLTEAVRERHWEFDYDGGLWTINGHVFDPNRIDAGIEQDSAEIWTFKNAGTGWHHPIHSHFTEFIIVEMNGRPFYQAEVQSGADETHIALSLAERLKTGREEYRAYMDEDTLRGVNNNQEKLQEIVSDSNSYLASQAFRPDQSNLMSKEAMSYARLLEVLKLSQPEESVASTDIPQSRAFNDLSKAYSDSGNDPNREIRNLVEMLTDESRDIETIIRNLQFRSAAIFFGFARIMWELGFGDLSLGLFDDEAPDTGRPDHPGRFTGGPRRDVALLLPGDEVKLFLRWKDFLGKHVMHCHNVVHEDHAMMIRWQIMPKGRGFDTPKHESEVIIGSLPAHQRREHAEPHARRSVAAPDDSSPSSK